MGTLRPAVHRAILIVDVESFGDPARTNAHQLAVRDGMYQALEQSFARAGISWAECAKEDRGDGALVLVPPEVPKSWLVTGLPAYLAEALVRHNAACPEQERIRLRMALHAGEVHQDAHGYAGGSINLAFRLIEAPAARTALRHSPAMVALIVSDWFYDEVVRHHPAAEPSGFRQAHVVMKETETTAWVRVLVPAEAPLRREAARITSARTALSHVSQVIPSRPVGVRYSLPPDAAAFTGRDEELDRITAAVTQAAGTGGVVAIHALDGMPGERRGEADALYRLGAVRRLTGDYPGADAVLEEALGIYRTIGDPLAQVETFNELGRLCGVRGDLGRSRAYHQQALDLAREIASPWPEAEALASLGRCALAAGRTAEAVASLRQAREIFERIGAVEATVVAAELDDLAGAGPTA